MAQKQKPNKREQYIVQIGPLLKKCLDDQLKSIKDVTYGSVKSSYYEAGEILAKKVLGMI
jgi:hypothetical protein